MIVLGEEVVACREEMHRSRGRGGLIYHRAFYFLALASRLTVFGLYFKMDSDSESHSVLANECVQLLDDLRLWLSRNIGPKGKKNILSVPFTAVIYLTCAVIKSEAL